MTSITSDPPALARRRSYSGPALFSYGFRPFFLAGSAWAAIAVWIGLLQHFGLAELPTAFAAIDWHAHEMLYGFVPAIAAGFLLTAIPNWTGRLPVNGLPLAGLVVLWFAGRLAVLSSDWIGAWNAAFVDLSFLATFTVLALREIVAGNNWRNLRVLAVLGILLAGNAIFHFEAIELGTAVRGARIGLAAVILLIMLIGGRIVPSFTHNWIIRNNPGRLPMSFGRYDVVSLAVAAAALASWVLAPANILAGVLLLSAGAAQAVRLARWAGDRVLADPLVFILHAGYAFVPLGFVLTGASVLWPDAVPPSAGIHSWAVGAIGAMTIAVMTRASLGHTGRALVASTATQAIYLCVLIAALARIAAPWIADLWPLYLAAAAWTAAFGGLTIVFGPLLLGPRL